MKEQEYEKTARGLCRIAQEVTIMAVDKAGAIYNLASCGFCCILIIGMINYADRQLRGGLPDCK